MSDWDDLFASAEGKVPTKVSVVEKSHPFSILDDPKTETHRRTKKQKFQHSKQFLDSRMDYHHSGGLGDALPTWIEIGKGLGKQCEKPIFSLDDNEVDSKYVTCQNCHLSVLHHNLEWKRNDKKEQDLHHNYDGPYKILKLFLNIRNIRASCSCILMLGIDKRIQKQMHVSPQDYLICGILDSFSNLCNIHSDLSSMLPTGENDVLRRKITCVTKCKDDLQISLKDREGQVSKKRTLKLRRVLQDVIRCIIACDDYYYRLYYLQVSNILPPRGDYHLPHPTTYFGFNNMTWDNQYGIKQRHHLMKIFQEDNHPLEEVTEVSFGLGIENSVLDPLTFLHQNRLNETILLFWSSGWLESEDTLKEYLESFHEKKPVETEEDKFYHMHETAAPLLLSEWRDSCRDLLCNLYGYATIPPSLVQTMQNFLSRLNVTNLVEMGAGTGYLGQVFRRGGFNIECYDLVPPQLGANEYHGHVKPYIEVNRGSVQDLPRIISRYGKNHCCGLLLCFPPPISSMAEDMLNSFIKSGGDVVVYVGEFHGLTGSPSFERSLRTNFELIFQQYCLSWGTDASMLTIWKLDKKRQPSIVRPVLLPCVHCRSKQSTIRLAVSRNLSFCSKQCFESFPSKSLQRHFRLSMIPETLALDYEKQQWCN